VVSSLIPPSGPLTSRFREFQRAKFSARLLSWVAE